MFQLSKFENTNVLCVGDIMLDRFIAGEVSRISPEGPVPIFALGHSTAIPGGAANVARNISSLTGRCSLLGIIGDDRAGDELDAALRSDERIRPCLVRTRKRPTTEKIRYISQGQQLLRADREQRHPIEAELEEEIVSKARQLLPAHQVVVLSDYAKGVLTDRVIAEIVSLAKHHNVPVVVDPKSRDFARYAGATLVTPNAKELHLATGIDPTSDNIQAESACQSVLERNQIENVLVTRAEHGMTLASLTGQIIHIKASARQVADVVGAGDTAIAAVALACGAGANMEEAARIANTAAGIVVGKPGTATVSLTELLETLLTAEQFSDASLNSGVLSWDMARQRIGMWRRDGLQIGFTNGCFDILHVGHLKLLNFARSNCDRLLIGLNTDASVRRLKGPSRPINSEVDRASLLASLNMVSGVVLFDQDTPRSLIELVQPDVLVKGADYDLTEIVGADEVLARGGRVLRCDLLPGKSTSNVISAVSVRSAAPTSA